jgi:hypothetical protein
VWGEVEGWGRGEINFYAEENNFGRKKNPEFLI